MNKVSKMQGASIVSLMGKGCEIHGVAMRHPARPKKITVATASGDVVEYILASELDRLESEYSDFEEVKDWGGGGLEGDGA